MVRLDIRVLTTASATLLYSWDAVTADPPLFAGPRPAAELAPYPPMHWHSWNTFCAEDMVNHTNMREMADALISSVRSRFSCLNARPQDYRNRHAGPE